MGYRIREIREELNMTQEELSEKSGISRATISGLENNTEKITTTRTLAKIAEALDTTVEHLFFAQTV